MPNSDIQIYPTVPPRSVDREGFRLREDVLYSDAKGREKAKLQRRAEKTLAVAGDVLRRVLEPGETIFYIADGQPVPGALAQFFGGGWHTYSLPRSVLFLTDRRILALRLRKKMRGTQWDGGIQSARWGDLSSIASGGFISRVLTVRFRNGESRQYWRFAAGDVKKLVQVGEALRQHASGETSAAGALVSLCPKCLAALTPKNYKCASCGEEFKDEKTLWRRALAIPGGASLYVGASGLGMVRAIFEAIITVLLIVSIVRFVGAWGQPEVQREILGSIAVECFVLFVDKVLAFYLALPQVRDFIPVNSQ